VEKRVKKWASIARNQLKATTPIPADKTTVVFSPGLLNAAFNPVIGHHVLGQSHMDNVSSFDLDAQVASENFTAIDNGLLEGGLHSNPWDAEGNPQGTNAVIQKGVFRKFLYDQKAAIMANTRSTGNCVRLENGSVTSDITNLQVEPGDISFEEIISSIKEGYYIEKCSWLNPDEFSGSFGAEIRSGHYIKDGALQSPIKGGNVSGNVLEMIKRCLYISKERETVSSSQLPYIAFGGLTISD
jgi:predicted Zn-dependent protease